MKEKILSVALALSFLIYWNFEIGYRDELQYSTDAGATWTTIPGPYPINSEWEYEVRVEGNYPSAIFRVRRNYWDAP